MHFREYFIGNPQFLSPFTHSTQLSFHQSHRMSVRALRRLQKELEVTSPSDASSNEEEEAYEEEHRPQKNAFDMLLVSADENDDDEEEPSDDDKQLAAAAAAAASAASTTNSTIFSTSNPPKRNDNQISAKKNKKKNKKNKKTTKASHQHAPVSDDNNHENNNTNNTTNDEEEDEIDRALRELQINPETAPVESPSDHVTSPSIPADPLDPMLTANAKRMDPESEMKRLFGNRIVQHQDLPQDGPAHRRRATRFAFGSRYVFSTPKETWPPMERLGMEMELVSTGSADGDHSNIRWFAFTHSSKYQQLEHQFQEYAASMVPEYVLFTNRDSFSITTGRAIADFLRQYPGHASTLLQLSYMAQQQGDFVTANEYLARAMFTFERAFHALFTPMTSPPNLRMSYFRAENRPFLLSMFKSIQAWMRKGCWQCAFEWAKVLTSWTRDRDPLGMWTLVDFLALKSGEFAWVRGIWNEQGNPSSFGKKHSVVNPFT